MEFHATVQPMGFDSSGCPNFYTYPFLENDAFGASGDTALTPAAETDFCSTFHTTTELGPGD